MRMINEISRYLVGALFIFSGLIKLNDPVGTAIKLEEYFNVFATDFAPFFHYFIPAALFLAVFLSVLEVVLGVALLMRYRIKLTAWALLVMIVFFTFLTFYSAYLDKVTDCGCFGDAIKLTPWESFIKDIILVVLIAILFVNRNRIDEESNLRSDIIVGTITAASIVVAIYAIEHLPFVDFRSYKVGADIPKLMQPSAELKYKYIMTKDGETFEFDRYQSDDGYEFKEMILLNPGDQPKITDYNVWNDEGDFTEQTFKGRKLFIVIHNVEKTHQASVPAINSLIANMGSNRVEPVVLTSSDASSFETFRHEMQLAVPYYFTDATVLKTIIRSNSGLILIEEGVVKGKWHYNDVPSVADINDLLSSG